MSKPAAPPGPLVAAALAMEEELRRLESLAREARALPLTSRRHLERTAERLRELGSGEARLQPCLQALSAAIAEVGERQRAAAEALAARVEEYGRREAALRALLYRYEALGKKAGEVNASLRDLAATREARAVRVVDVEEASRQMGQLIADAGELTRAATEERFEDVARDGHALQQQLASSRNKLNLFREKLSAVTLPS
jgi:chromosome segregation ATPase